MPARTIDTVTLEERARSFARRSIKGEAKRAGLRLAMSVLDLTTLEGADSPERVRALCVRARRPHAGPIDEPVPAVAAVCVYPALVEVARESLAGSRVAVASVVTGFPSAQYPLDVRLADVRAAVDAGADEVDMVISRGAFLSGRPGVVTEEVRETRMAAGPAILKIILETGELATPDAIRRAADLALEAASSVGEVRDGEVFLKTSTGKVSPGATPASTLVLLQAVADHHRATGVRVGVKAAGGIRTARSAIAYLVMVKETLSDAWLTPRLFRIGASSLADDLLRQIVAGQRGGYAARYDVARGG